jgi:uncharacterized protein involved in exopolysaccharide biosynthesis
MPNDGVSIFGTSKVNLENQIENIKSSRIIGNVVDSLNLTSEMYSEGRLKSQELGNNLAFNVVWALENDSIKNKLCFNHDITIFTLEQSFLNNIFRTGSDIMRKENM